MKAGEIDMNYLLIASINAATVAFIFFMMFLYFHRYSDKRQLELLAVITNAKDPYILSHQDHVSVLSLLLYNHLPKELKKKSIRKG